MDQLEDGLGCENRSRMWLRRVGIVRREEENPQAELVIDDDLPGILDGVEEFSHLLVLYWADRIPPERRSWTRVHPRGREDLPLVGIFATHSPARPNTICATMVRLLERKGNRLTVEGLDALDDSPLVDIKPFEPGSYSKEEVKLPEWWHR